MLNGRKGPHIRVDTDGVEVWDGKREEAIPMIEEELEEMNEEEKENLKELEEMENLLKDFK